MGNVLTITKNGELVRTFPLLGEASLGRGEGCAIRLDDRAISRQHAIFRVTGKDIQVENKSEFAPLIVNGVECTRSVLKNGDRLGVGPYIIEVSSQKTQPPRESAVGVAVEQPPTHSDYPELEVATKVSSEKGPTLEDLASSEDSAILENNNDPPAELSEFSTGEPSESAFEDPAIPVDEDGKTKFTPAAKLSVRLLFKPGDANVEDYEITQDSITVGRGSNCDLILNDKKSSRKNSLIQRAGLSFVIKDLDSSNGTFVNGVKVKDHELSGDDVIRIGNVEFQFKATSEEYVAQEQGFMPVPQEEASSDFHMEESLPSEVSNELMTEHPPMEDLGLAQNIGADIGNIPGIAGISTSGKTSLIEKFKALPKRTQAIIALFIAFGGYSLYFDEPAPEPKKKSAVTKKADATELSKASVTYASLSGDQKRFIDTQRTLALDYFKNKDYDKSLFEIQKIFSIIPDHKEAREIERYAKEGKLKLEAREEEQRKKEKEQELKSKIAEKISEVKDYMAKKQYAQAKELFAEVSAIDPENTDIANWKKEIESYEEQVKAKAQQKEVQAEISAKAWATYKSAIKLKKAGKFHSAISAFKQILETGSLDSNLLMLAKKMIGQSMKAIQSLREPVLKEAKQAEDGNDFLKAFALYRKATRIDPPHSAGYAGMNRIKGVLHESAKGIYTEAVLAESYSDFATARKLFKKCLETAPPDDIYHERAERRLAHYFGGDELYTDASAPADAPPEAPPQEGEAATPPSEPQADPHPSEAPQQ